MVTLFMVHIPACTAPRALIGAMALLNGKACVLLRSTSRKSKLSPVTET